MDITRLHQLSAQADEALAEFAAIDLGYKWKDCYPSLNSSDNKTQYPGLYLSNLSADLSEIPDEGKAVISYRMTSRNMNESNGKKTFGMSLDVLSFEPEKAAKKDAKDKAEGKAVKLSAVIGQTQFADTRNRNGNGEFVGNETGGADPVSMRQAYAPKAPDKAKAQSSLLAPGAAAGALAGAGLLGSKAGRVVVVKAAKGASRMVRAGVGALDRKVSGKTGEMWPRMGSKARPAPKRKEGLGEVMFRASRKGKTGARWPRSGD